MRLLHLFPTINSTRFPCDIHSRFVRRRLVTVRGWSALWFSTLFRWTAIVRMRATRSFHGSKRRRRRWRRMEERRPCEQTSWNVIDQVRWALAHTRRDSFDSKLLRETRKILENCRKSISRLARWAWTANFRVRRWKKISIKCNFSEEKNLFAELCDKNSVHEVCAQWGGATKACYSRRPTRMKHAEKS